MAKQKNSDLSTGPRTPAGKAASSANSTTHGCRSANHIILPTESEAVYLQLEEKYRAEYDPFNAFDEQMIIHCAERQWARMRCELQLNQVRAKILARTPDASDWTPEDHLLLERMERYLQRADSSWRASWRDIARLRHDRARDVIDDEKALQAMCRSHDDYGLHRDPEDESPTQGENGENNVQPSRSAVLQKRLSPANASQGTPPGKG